MGEVSVGPSRYVLSYESFLLELVPAIALESNHFIISYDQIQDS